jgi:hypothetical protein
MKNKVRSEEDKTKEINETWKLLQSNTGFQEVYY